MIDQASCSEVVEAMSEPPLFGSLLKRHRLDRGLTHEALAERATLSVRAISDLERGVSTFPRLDTVKLLAAALNLSPIQREAFLWAAGRGRRWEESARRNVAVSGIPVPLTSLIGREQDLAMLRHLLLGSGARLVTITGPGGVGKTRLAVESAMSLVELFEDGVRYVPLSAATKSNDILRAITSAVGLSEHPTESTAVVLADYLRDRQMVLVLDNFEHLLESAPLLTELLRRCPRLAMLVTSRSALRLSGEHEVPLKPLPTFDVAHLPPLDEMACVPSVALLVARATASCPTFALAGDNAVAIATICSSLDGLPLALELVAARFKLFTADALLARLIDDPPAGSLNMLVGGARDWPNRHQCLRDTIAWSYDLLTRDEKWLVRQLSVFPGGCTLEAADAVCGAALSPTSVLDLAVSLQEKSLIQQVVGPDDKPRIIMLETIRRFALEKLDACGEEHAARRRHAEYYVSMIENTGGLLFANAPQRQRSAAEQDNLEAALRWFVRHG